MPNFILYRDVPIDDFLAAYRLSRDKPGEAYLPPENLLRDFKFNTRYEGKGVSHPVFVYFLNQYDIINDSTTPFVIFQTDTAGERVIENIARRFRSDLKAQGFETLFRVDPRYGIAVGSARNSVDPNIRHDRARCFITLCVTNDPSHTEVSLMEYVDRDLQERYKEIFRSYNNCLPKKRGVLGFDLSKLRAGGFKGEADSVFGYEHIRYFASALKNRYALHDLFVSLIYKNMAEDDLKRAVLDPSKGLFYPSGECKFFNTTEELLA